MKKVIILLIATLLISCQTEFGKFDEDKDFIYGICYDYETDENGYFGYTFRELWEMFNQNKLIFMFRKDSAESSVPEATDYKTRLFMVFRMEYTGGINYYLTLLACSEDSQAIMSPCIGSANTSPCIH